MHIIRYTLYSKLPDDRVNWYSTSTVSFLLKNCIHNMCMEVKYTLSKLYPCLYIGSNNNWLIMSVYYYIHIYSQNVYTGTYGVVGDAL